MPQKAWTGMNPITQRSSTSNQQNGVGPQPKGNTPKTAMNLDPRNVDQCTQERMLYWLGNFMVSYDLYVTQAIDISSDNHTL